MLGWFAAIHGVLIGSVNTTVEVGTIVATAL